MPNKSVDGMTRPCRDDGRLIARVDCWWHFVDAGAHQPGHGQPFLAIWLSEVAHFAFLAAKCRCYYRRAPDSVAARMLAISPPLPGSIDMMARVNKAPRPRFVSRMSHARRHYGQPSIAMMKYV